MKYILFFFGLALAVTIFYLTDTNRKLKNFKYSNHIIAGVMILIFIVRYFCVDKSYAINNVIGLEKASALSGASVAVSAFAMIADYLSITAFVVTVMRLFFGRMKYSDAFIKYVLPFASVLCLVFVEEIHSILACDPLIGSGDAFNSQTLFTLTLSFESGVYLALSGYTWYKDIKDGYYKTNKVNYKTILVSAGVTILMLIASLPCYFLQFTFGRLSGAFYAYDMSPTHRIFVYLMFIIPLSLYFFLRDKPEKVIRYSLIFLSVSSMITFSADYSYKTFPDLSTWPFHLCNTAMFVVPICLIFRWKKLFYFTYFINVFGAILAMLMPNYAEHANLISYGVVRFWYNHWSAFFFPLVCVALRQFERPDIKLFGTSMLWFLLYYVLVLFLNVYFTAQGKSVDFFFINSNFIADKFGEWANRLFNLSASFELGGYTFTFHPIYQAIYFVSYILLGFGMWFIYELFFSLAEKHRELHARLKKIRLDKLALEAGLNGRSIEQPMNPDAGITLQLNNFSKRYGNNKHYSVHNVSFTVHGGEIFGFLGPNGAGKSTIIKSIVGIQPISEGSIEVCGFDCAKQPVMSKRQIGYVPDHYALYEKLSGREYINYIADIFEVKKEDRDARISEYVKLFELEDSIDNQIKTYSHGMKQKITIISALVHNPKIWILDEPLTGLDPNSIFQVKECMRRHAAQGNIVFFSSHLIDVVEKLCDRIGIIKKGELQCVMTLEEIERSGSLEDFYMKTIEDNKLNLSESTVAKA